MLISWSLNGCTVFNELMKLHKSLTYLHYGRGTNSGRLSDRLLEGTIHYVILFQINVWVNMKIIIRKEERTKNILDSRLTDENGVIW